MKYFILLVIPFLFIFTSCKNNTGVSITNPSDTIVNVVTSDTENTVSNTQVINDPEPESIPEVIIEDTTTEPPSDRDCVKSVYDSQIGIREKTGNNDGKEVEAYLASAGLGKGYAWCASFVNWTFLQCDKDFGLESPAWVPSWFPKSKTIYVRGQKDIRPPQKGDLIGIWYESKGRLAHIGFYDSETEYSIISVEGNTNDEGSREGDGVYRKVRLKRTVHSISSWID